MERKADAIVDEMVLREHVAIGHTSNMAKELVVLNEDMGPRDLLLLLSDMFETMGELNHEDIGAVYSNLSIGIADLVDEELSDEEEEGEEDNESDG